MDIWLFENNKNDNREKLIRQHQESNEALPFFQRQKLIVLKYQKQK